MSFPVTTTWPEEWGIDADDYKSNPDLFAALTRKFGEIQQQVAQAFAEHRRDLPNLLRVMVDHSWYPDFQLPVADTRALETRAAAEDVAAIDGLLSDCHP